MGATLSKDWYFAEGSRTLGPLELDELIATLLKKKDGERTLVWRDGMTDWTLARDVAEIRFPPSPPPLPHSRARQPVATQGVANADTKKPSAQHWQTIGGIAVAVVSFGIARVVGSDFWIPFLLLALSFWLASKTPLEPSIRPVFAVALGHALWMAVGATILLALNSGKYLTQVYELLPDLIIMTAILGWLYFQQSKASLFGLIAYEIISLAINAYVFSTHPNPRFAMIVHIGIRLFIIGSSIYAINKLSDQRRSGEQAK